MKRCDTVEKVLSRRGLLTAAGVAGAALAMPGKAAAELFGKQSSLINDYDILNFALNLEYLEAEFYSYATTGHGIDSGIMTGVGTPGSTIGGSIVKFTDAKIRDVALDISKDELAHVVLLREALGPYAVAKPAINLNALGFGFGSMTEFLMLSRAFEDTGVSAYGGAATAISSAAYLQVAAQILATEAYHSGNIRFQIAGTTNSVMLDNLDIPPTLTKFFPTDGHGLCVIRTPAEVLSIVRGSNASGGNFFPMGLNGNIM